MALNENIKKYRKKAEMTQKDLARQSGLSFSMISKLEIGEQTNPSFETIRKIADVLRVSPGELVNNPISIEDQIDEYIAYKRGLSKINSKSVVMSNDNDLDDPCSDLNFKKKLQAINGIPMPLDDTSNGFPEYWERRPEVKKLFSVLNNATKDEIIQVTRLLEAVKGPLNT